MATHQPSLFGMLLRRHRLAAGLTQERLAEDAGISARGISDLERGTSTAPREDTVQRLAAALGLADEDRAQFVTTAHELRAAVGQGGGSRAIASGTESKRPANSERFRVLPLPLLTWPRVLRRHRYARWTVGVSIAILLAVLLDTQFALIPGNETRTDASGPTLSSRPVAVWGGPVGRTRPLQFPDGVAVDSQGNVYVADFRLNIVQKYSPAGQPLTQIGASNGVRFDGPVAVAVDPTGNLYVLDQGNQRLQKISPAGAMTRQWRIRGGSVAVDGKGQVYVLDSGQNLVRELLPDGRPGPTWGTTGWDVGAFIHPLAVAVDGKGVIYVADTDNHRIETFASGDHQFLQMVSVGSNVQVAGLAVDARGDIYVADIAEAVVLKLAPDGTVLARWGTLGSGSGLLQSPNSIALDRQGNIYVGDGDAGNVDVLSPQGKQMASWTVTQAGGIRLDTPRSVAVDRQGNVYVLGGLGPQVSKISPDGRLLASWVAHPPVANALETSYGGITVDRAGTVYVTQNNDYIGIVNAYTPAGSWAASFGQFLDTPEGVVVDAGGNVYIADSGSNRILTYAPIGTQLSAWGARNSGRFAFPGCLALDHDGDLYVADSNYGKIEKLDRRGRSIAHWGRNGSGPLEFQFSPQPCGIAVDERGRIYVTDTGNDRVQILSSDGRLLQILGRHGTAPGQFAYPTGVAVDHLGNLYVVDSGNNRVQKFAPAR